MDKIGTVFHLRRQEITVLQQDILFSLTFSSDFLAARASDISPLLCLCSCTYVCLCLHATVTSHICMCFHASEKLLSDTAAHCSPPIHPPWHNSLWPLAHMTLLHCCLPLLLAKGLLPSPTLALLLFIVGRPVNTSPRLQLHPGDFGQNLARQIEAKRTDQHFSLLFSSSLFLPC